MGTKLLNGKNAVVTGTARGIGHKIVEVFAANGANVWACARKQTDEMDAYCTALSEKYGVAVKPVYFELTDRAAMKDAVKAIIAEKKPIDILVNNAGITYNALFQMSTEEWIHSRFASYMQMKTITYSPSREIMLPRSCNRSAIRLVLMARCTNAPLCHFITPS